ncbi:MAG: hypothetical protein ETSY1_33970 [Candidatus Entotheonella factor]|uniref:Uncharacterized protein n=1 Tax=Entotheonella factor TaxID=1429438 RepID=W4LBD5_ENTF1|nr:hypothetical protein [Candidatus Entotheonella palauensis]ETW94636.1 MAG: hypothetical protein ETSY1_33970 [Candidatus Entotheonella factor]
MQVTVTTIVFGLPQGQRTSHVEVSLPAPALSLQELIARKVEQEVLEVQAHQRMGLSGEYLTAEALILATGSCMPGAIEDEIQRAQQAFAARDFMIVIDDRQVWEADTVVNIEPETQVEFIKILPLVGG